MNKRIANTVFYMITILSIFGCSVSKGPKIYVLKDYIDTLEQTHSHYAAMGKSKGIVFAKIEKGKGYWTDSFSEFQKFNDDVFLKIVFKDKKEAIISGKQYRYIGTESNNTNVFSAFIISKLFISSLYSDGKNQLSVKNGQLFLNNEQYDFVLSTQFNESGLDYITRRNGNSYVVEIAENEIKLYYVDLFMGFGIRKGEIAFDLLKK